MQIPRVLIVDDNLMQMNALSDALSDQGLQVMGCSTPTLALDALGTHDFDVLLTDLQMPGMDGIGLIRAMHEHDAELVGIVMTGVGTVPSAVEAMKAGAFDYILKPFGLAEVLVVIERAMAMRRLRADNARYAREAQERSAEMANLNEELEAFSYSVSHDLRAPLRRIEQYGTILRSEHAPVLPATGTQLVDRICANARKMSMLIDDLLALSRAARAPLRAQQVDLSGQASAIIDDLRSADPQRQVETAIAPGLRVDGDAGLLRIVLTNLLANAWKYTGPNPQARIDFTAQTVAGTRVFRLSDNGVGFDMAYADRLFAPFQRLHHESEFAGNGIGLSIVARIIKRHGGWIRATGAVGVGAVFTFTIGSGPDDDRGR